jgi:hypothetical protein
MLIQHNHATNVLPFANAFLTPGSGIGFSQILDFGSRILNPYF